MSAKTRRGKRRSREKESPTEKGVEEETMKVQEAVSSPGGKGDWGAAGRWDDIGEEEEMYLASTREELYELMMKKDTFRHKVKEKDCDELIELTNSLVEYGRLNVEELQMLQPEEDVRDCPKERSRLGKFTALVSFQNRRMGWMMWEFADRLREANKALESRVNAVKMLKGILNRFSNLIQVDTVERNKTVGNVAF